MGHFRKTQLSIFLNDRCNLACKYCYINDSSKKQSSYKKIDIRFVKRAILDFFKQYESREIRFFSMGEATVEFNLLKEITDWTYEISNKKATFEMQTNGFFADRVTKWLADNMNIVWVSYDGLKDVQDFYRPTLNQKKSSMIVEKNIKTLASCPDLTLGVRITIGNKNINLQKEIIDYLGSLNVKAIMTDPIFASVTGDQNFVDEIDLLEYAKKYLVARKYAESKNIFYGSIYTVNFDEISSMFCRSSVPYPHLTIDGYVSCCDMGYSGSNTKMKDLIYGKYIPKKDIIEYDQKAIQKIQSRTSKNMPHCQDCEVLDHCAGACLGESLNETGSMFGVKPEVCEAIKFLAKNLPLNEGIYPYLHP